MIKSSKFLAPSFFLLTLVLTGCATPPPGPSVAVMPAPGKAFEQFTAEDQTCRQFALESSGMGTVNNTQTIVGSAAVGTVLGAAAGSLMSGGHHHGAESGAGMGMIAGTAVGAGQGAANTQSLQRRYDIAYEQCMYSKGNQLPGMTRALPPTRQGSVSQPSTVAPYYPPPPPPVSH